MHKYLAVKDRKIDPRGHCGLCKHALSTEDDLITFHGRYYHLECFQEELKKPLKERFSFK